MEKRKLKVESTYQSTRSSKIANVLLGIAVRRCAKETYQERRRES